MALSLSQAVGCKTNCSTVTAGHMALSTALICSLSLSLVKPTVVGKKQKKIDGERNSVFQPLVGLAERRAGIKPEKIWSAEERRGREAERRGGGELGLGERRFGLQRKREG